MKIDPAQTELVPGQEAALVVTLGTRYSRGPKTFHIDVQFDRPREAVVRLQVQADSRDDLESKEESNRLQELDKKLDTLLKEVDGSQGARRGKVATE